MIVLVLDEDEGRQMLARRTMNPGEYIVTPDGAVARFVVTRKDLEVLP